VTDADLLRAAVAASGLPRARFGRDVLGYATTDTIYRQLAGSRALQPSARVLCQLVIEAPELVGAIQAACAALRGAAGTARV
jgi:hypothetical protein